MNNNNISNSRYLSLKLPNKYFIWGIISALGTILLSCRLIWEMTILTYQNGEQMIGFSLVHTTPFLIMAFLFLSVISSFIFILSVLYYFIRHYKRGYKINKFHLGLSLFIIFSLITFFVPYSFWQHVMLFTLGPGKSGASLMCSAAFNNDISLVQSYLNHGIGVDDRNHYDETALMNAAKSGNTRLAEFLLDKGANPLAETLPGENAFTIALEWKRYDFARFIFHKGPQFIYFSDSLFNIDILSNTELANLFKLEDSLKHLNDRYKTGSDSVFRMIMK